MGRKFLDLKNKKKEKEILKNEIVEKIIDKIVDKKVKGFEIKEHYELNP